MVLLIIGFSLWITARGTIRFFPRQVVWIREKARAYRSNPGFCAAKARMTAGWHRPVMNGMQPRGKIARASVVGDTPTFGGLGHDPV